MSIISIIIVIIQNGSGGRFPPDTIIISYTFYSRTIRRGFDSIRSYTSFSSILIHSYSYYY